MRDWIHRFASLRITVGLLVVLLVALSAGTIVESMRGPEAALRTVYMAGWFRLLLAVFALNLACSIADMWPWGRSRIGYVLTHGSMLVVLGGSLATELFKTEGVLAIWEGEATGAVQDRSGLPGRGFVLPFELRLDAFEVDYYPGTRRPAQFRSRVTVKSGGQELPAVIEMNRELAFGGYRFFQSSYRETPERDMTVLSVSRDPGEPIVFLGYYGVVIGMIVVFATRIAHRRALVAATAGAAALLIAAPAFAQSVPDATDVEALRRLPVQHDGRVMPFDTVAREAVFNISGRPEIFGLDPVAAALGMAFDPDGWIVQPIVRVDASLGAAIGLPAGTRWVSFADLVRSTALGELLQAARATEAQERALGGLQKAARKVEGRLVAMQSLLDHSALAVVPAAAGAPWSVPTLRSVADLRAVQAAGSAGSGTNAAALEREITYNRARPTRIAWWILAVSLVLSLLAWRLEKRALDVAAFGALLLGFAAMSWGIGTRWKIAGYIPASNMYESLLFLGWGVGLFAVVATLFVRSRLVVFNAAAMSTLTMALTDLLPIDPFLHPMPPVLAGTYWLAVHVPIIMVGYAVLALGVAIAHMQIGSEIFAPRKRELSQRMNQLLYWYVMVGSILLLVGILTGSMWAAESWGRYWGWDPKEVWSLVAFLAYMAILHARAERLIGPFGMAAWSLVAFQTILMTYLGVNFVLASGLHSYGFGESHVVQGMLLALLAELGFVGAGWAVVRKRGVPRAPSVRAVAA
jgi:cytochrome c-type biogenesis protein CcsB